MSEGRPVGSTWRRVPFGLLGALALVAAVERHVERNAIDYMGGNHWSCRVASAVAGSGPGAGQLLCFGDSLLKLGIAPRVIEAEAGLPGYNFALTGGQAPGSYLLLRRALESGAKPRAILVDFFPSLMAAGPSFNDENWPFLAGIRDAYDYARLAGGRDSFARLAAGIALPTVRSRAALRSDVATALQPGPVSIKDEILKSIRNWSLNRGAEIVAARPGVAENLDVWVNGYFPAFRCEPANRAYIRRFLRLAARHDIPVFWLLPPYQPSLQSRVEATGFDAQHMAFVRRFAAEFPGVTVLDARHSAYPVELFFDLHHLGREGAASLSADVGRAVASHLSGSGSPTRWVELPAYRPRPLPVPMEDVDQSRLAVRREAESRAASRLR